MRKVPRPRNSTIWTADLERENIIHGEWVQKFGAVLELSREYALCIGTEFSRPSDLLGYLQRANL